MNDRHPAEQAKNAEHAEAQRQQHLLAALWRSTPGADAALTAALAAAPDRQRQGLAAYRSNGLATAERALSAGFPTVLGLVGAEAMAGLSRAHWRQHPPCDGDLAAYGATLPGFIAADPQLADWPYLADVARLDWAVHCAESAADHTAPLQGLQRLGGDAAGQCRLMLRPGTAVIRSPWPVVSLWKAQRDEEPGALRQAAQALQAAQAQSALVLRAGWRVQVHELCGPGQAEFTQAILSGQTLAQALDAQSASEGTAPFAASFDFHTWLILQLETQALVAVLPGEGPC